MTSAVHCKPKAILLGAFDRFNYGDLLFPLLVRNEFEFSSPGTATAVHALVDSDLTRFGALKTKALKTIYQLDVLAPDDVVIFAGGGTIGADWTHMFANLLGNRGNAALYYLARLIGDNAVNALSRRRFGAYAPFPWVAGPEDFPVPVKVAYNAVGGSEFGGLTASVQKRTLDRLGKATYLSVRDAETQRLFSPLQSQLPVELAPDSAILMSEQFPIERLEARASGTLRESLDAAPYVCFQSNLHYARKNADQIASVLEFIYREHGLSAVLLPIGRYVGLDDHIALSTVLRKVRTPAGMVSHEASVFDIMLTIAKARLFVGTSLHGSVTSQSFAVPHLGLSDHPCKVDFYLETWDLPEQSRCVPIKEIPGHVGTVLAIPETARLQKRRELMASSHDNFSRMAAACGIDWQSRTSPL